MLKKSLSLLLSTVLMFSIVPSAAADSVLRGAGTESNPFLASDESTLNMISDFPDAYWKLTNDIELTGDWVSVGTAGDDFSGTLDGNGYKITGLNVYETYIYGANKKSCFIEYNYGTIKNLRLEGTITTETSGSGFLVYSNKGIIENCSTSGAVINKTTKWSDPNAGGMACFNSGVIKNSYSRVEIIRTNLLSLAANDLREMAGFVSTNSGTIINCYAACEMSWPSGVTAAYIPHGFCGYASGDDANAENCCYDKGLSGCSDDVQASGRSTAAMKMQAGYTGWDFDTVWAMDPDINDGYPYLQCERSPFVRLTGIALDRNELTLNEGESVRLSAAALPTGAEMPEIEWSTSSKYVASVDAAAGLVTGVSEGTARITATSADGEFSDFCMVTVLSPGYVTPTPQPTSSPTAKPTSTPVSEPTDAPDSEKEMCGDNIYWSYADGTLTLTGTGAMYSYEYNNYAPWYDFAEEIKNIVISEGVTKIGGYAFYKTGIEGITLPESVISIGMDAFGMCKSLKSITLPAAVTSFSEGVFGFCDSLTEINVDEGNSKYKSIGGVLFTKDNRLVAYPDAKPDEEYHIPAETVKIYTYAFYYNDALKRLYIPLATTLDKNSLLSVNNLTIYTYSGSPAAEYALAKGWNLVLYQPYTKTTVTETGLTSELTDIPEGSVIIIASYDENDCLISAQTAVTDGSGTFTANGNFSDAKSLRIFVWNSTIDMKPITQTERI